MKEELRELYKYRELLYMISYRDVTVRYKQSVMGALWAILMPILIVAAGIVVRYVYAMASGKALQTADIANVAVKSLPWAFMVGSIRFSSTSLINNQNLVSKVYFPKEVFPIGAVLASFFDFLVASAALVVFLVSSGTGWSAELLWVPLLLLIMIVQAAGIAMIVSAAALFFRDVKYIVEVVLTFGIFFTPVFYDVQMLGRRGHWLLLNPFAPILEAFSATVIRRQQPELLWLAYSLLFSFAALFGGFVFFKHREPVFAESI